MNYKTYKEKEREFFLKKDIIENKQKILNEDLHKKLYKSANNISDYKNIFNNK